MTTSHAASRRAHLDRPDLSGFVEPDWLAPLDVDAHVAACRPDATSRGMFFTSLLEQVTAAGGVPPTSERFVSFKSYPQRRYIELLVTCARQAYPGVSLRQALRLVGRTVYPTFASSLTGKVIFGVLGKNIAAVMQLCARGYEVSTTNAGTAEVLESSADHVIVRFTALPMFLDSYNVGVFEGAFDACEVQGRVRVKLRSRCDGDFLVEWW